MIVALYGLHLLLFDIVTTVPYLKLASHAVFELINTLWWGILLGMLMVIRQTTASWKVALALPLISVPQIVLIAWLMNLGS